jgi:serine/threonine-protein kinase
MADPNPLGETTSPALLAGTPYTFIRQLGQGAHGVVVEAEQTALRRRVVLKLLRSELAGRADLVDRLRLEAQAIAAVAPLTPHVVSVIELGCTPGGRPYIVMERLEGRTLEDELAARGALPVAEAVALARQILDGLAAAHDAGIVHRDIKPANVFLCGSAEGRIVKLLDFGIAKLVRDVRAGGPAPLAQPTRDGTSLGTPRFFSPEQARGEAASPQSDLYSTGAVLYTMLTGRDPFHARATMIELVKAHLDEAPRPPSACVPHPIPEALDAAVLKALAKRPAERFGSAREFGEAIERAFRSAGKRWAQTERMGPPSASVPPASAAAAGVAAVGVRSTPGTPVAVPRGGFALRRWTAKELAVIGLATLVGSLSVTVIVTSLVVGSRKRGGAEGTPVVSASAVASAVASAPLPVESAPPAERASAAPAPSAAAPPATGVASASARPPVPAAHGRAAGTAPGLPGAKAPAPKSRGLFGAD